MSGSLAKLWLGKTKGNKDKHSNFRCHVRPAKFKILSAEHSAMASTDCISMSTLLHACIYYWKHWPELAVPRPAVLRWFDWAQRPQSAVSSLDCRHWFLRGHPHNFIASYLASCSAISHYSPPHSPSPHIHRHASCQLANLRANKSLLMSDGPHYLSRREDLGFCNWWGRHI